MELTNIYTSRNETTVIQKFIKSNGPKAFICRTVWRKGKNAYSWIITNKYDYYSKEKVSDNDKYVTNVKNMGSCTIVQTCKGKFVDETTPYIENILRYLKVNLGVTFLEFIGDFIKDESGIWWFINTKGFIIESHPTPLNVK